MQKKNMGLLDCGTLAEGPPDLLPGIGPCAGPNCTGGLWRQFENVGPSARSTKKTACGALADDEDSAERHHGSQGEPKSSRWVDACESRQERQDLRAW